MTQHMPGSRLRHKVKFSMPRMSIIWQLKDSRRDTRHRISISSRITIKGSLMPGISGMKREMTDMMTVTRLWREPVIRDMHLWCPRVHSDLGWDLGNCRPMMSAISWTESICRKSWRSKAHLARLASQSRSEESHRCHTFSFPEARKHMMAAPSRKTG